MPWVRVPESYDAPPGEKIRLIYRVEVPPYLPPQSKEWLVQQVATQVWPQVQTAHPDFRAENYEIVEVEPGRVYHVVFYGTSGGLGIGAILILVLAIIVAAIVLVSVAGYWAEKFIPPEVRETFVNLLPFMLMFGMLILIVAATR